jgi:hypothetical protein
MPPDRQEAEEILANVPQQARTAFRALRDFFKWREDNMSALGTGEFMRKLADYATAGAPLAASYYKTEHEHPDLMGRLVAIVAPIEQEIL